MIARTVFVASLLAVALVALAARAEASTGFELRGNQEASTSEQQAERPACRVVKVVYSGHGEAERAPCRPAR